MSTQDRTLTHDLWGQVCTDFCETGRAPFIFRRDDGLEDPSDPAGYFRTELSPPEARAMEKASGRILDIGCGVGADVLWLQAHGKKVTGIDISPGAIAIARKRGAQDVHILSMWDIHKLNTTFDTIILMGNNMGLAGSPEETARFLRLLHSHTNPGALLIGHSIDPTATSDEHHLAYQRQNVESGRYRGTVRIRLEYKGLVSGWWDLVFFEKETLLGLCSENGWMREEVVQWGNSFFVIARRS